MTKDAERLLKYIVAESKKTNNTEVAININEIKNIPNIRFAKNKLFHELEKMGVISGIQKNVLGEIYVYLTSDGLDYFQEHILDKSPSEVIINVSGGQVNFATDNANISAVMENADACFEKDYKKIDMNDLLIDFCGEECFVYSLNVSENALLITDADEGDTCLHMAVNLGMVSQDDFLDKFIGYCIKDLPDDWRWMITQGYCLNIEYKVNNEIEMWIEIKTPINELYKKKFLLCGESMLSIDLGKYMKRKEKWLNISEMCLVFRPCAKKVVNSNIRIKDIKFIKK